MPRLYSARSIEIVYLPLCCWKNELLLHVWGREGLGLMGRLGSPSTWVMPPSVTMLFSSEMYDIIKMRELDGDIGIWPGQFQTSISLEASARRSLMMISVTFRVESRAVTLKYFGETDLCSRTAKFHFVQRKWQSFPADWRLSWTRVRETGRSVSKRSDLRSVFVCAPR